MFTMRGRSLDLTREWRRRKFWKHKSHHNNVTKFVVAWRSVFTQDGWSAFNNNAMNVDVNVAPIDQWVLAMRLLYLSVALMMPLIAVRRRGSSKRLTSRSLRRQLPRWRILLRRHIAKLECLSMQRTLARTNISRRSWILKRRNAIDTEILLLPHENLGVTEPECASGSAQEKTALAYRSSALAIRENFERKFSLNGQVLSRGVNM